MSAHGEACGREVRRPRTGSRPSPSAQALHRTHSQPLRQGLARRWPPGRAAACMPNTWSGPKSHGENP
eukprot:5931832-Prymnesium_polylepis.1